MSDIEVLRKLTKIFNELRKDDEEGHSSAYELQWEDISVIENLIIENEKLIQENKELKEEKVLNEKILYFANNTLCNYQEGYQAGLHKEITATEIVAEEREKFIIAQEIKRLKDTIHELHNQLDEGNKRVKENYIPKTKVKEKIEELDKEMAKDEVDEFGIHSQGWAALDWTRDFLLKLLEEGE